MAHYLQIIYWQIHTNELMHIHLKHLGENVWVEFDLVSQYSAQLVACGLTVQPMQPLLV